MTNQHGVIHVYRTDTQDSLGYISKTTLDTAPTSRKRNGPDTAVLQVTDAGIDNAMIIDFSYPTANTSPSEFEITQENVDFPGQTLVGLITAAESSSPDLASGCPDYGWFGGVASTAPGAMPAIGESSYSDTNGDDETNIESSVWSFDTVNNVLSVQWINSDGSMPTMDLWVQASGPYTGEINYGGDIAEWTEVYEETVYPVLFIFEALVTPSVEINV